MSIQTCLSPLCGGLAVVVGLTGITHGQTTDSISKTDAPQLVRTALQHELKANAADRDRFLQAALQADPDYAPAHWHAADVLLGDEWLPVDEAMERLSQDEQLSAYRWRREQTPETPAAELSLARWCRKRDLIDREQFHLARVVSDPRSTAPQRATAIDRLQRILGRGDHAQNNRQERDQRAETLRAQKAWEVRVAQWASDFHSPAVRRRTKAEESLRAIDDLRAIPALESSLSTASPAGAQLVIDILANVRAHEATLSLLRHALFVPWPAVAESAVAQLKERPQHEFVPLLLARLETPISMVTAMTPDSSGQVSRRHLFFREGVQQDFVHVLDIVNAPSQVAALPRRMRDDGAARNRVLASVQTPTPLGNAASIENSRGTADLQLRVDAENARIAQQNDRVFGVLEGATYVVLPRDSVAWWNWWRDHNEVADPYANQSKPTELTYSQQRDRMATLTSGSGLSSAGVQECFVAGTLVWSELGQVAIEILRAGDLVLTQHPDTGELRFQPIVERTVRPPTFIVAVTIDGEDCADTRHERPSVLGQRPWVADGQGTAFRRFPAHGGRTRGSDRRGDAGRTPAGLQPGGGGYRDLLRRTARRAGPRQHVPCAHGGRRPWPGVVRLMKVLPTLRCSSDRRRLHFLYFPICPPHTPVAPAAEFTGKSGAKDLVKHDPRYGHWLYQGATLPENAGEGSVCLVPELSPPADASTREITIHDLF